MLGCPCHSSQVPTNSPEPTPIPNPEDRASHQKSQNRKEIAQLHFRVAWNLWPLDFFQFTPLDMGMYILGLSYHYALEAENLLSGFKFHRFTVVAVQWLSHVQRFATPWNAACQASLSFTMSRSMLKHMSIELMMPSNNLNLCHSLFLLPQTFSASGSFPVSWLFAFDGQSIGASSSASVLPMKD